MNRKIPFLVCGIAIIAACAFSLHRLQTPKAPSGVGPVGTDRAGVAPPVARDAPEPDQKAAHVSAFSGARAYALLQAQCDFGPRPNGSAAHEKTSAFLIGQMRPVVDEITLQKWHERIATGPGAGQTFAMTNILGMIRGTADKSKKTAEIRPAFMVSAHWDTRPVADEDPDLYNRNKPILGADDGASGVAVVLELARVLHKAKPQQTIVFALWDAEDLGEFFYGAHHFAELSKTAAWQRWKPAEGVLLDMIGDKDLQISREENSMRLVPDLWDRMANTSKEIGYPYLLNGSSLAISDDHLPLNDAGIPTIDLIDFDYPSWHTLKDTPDKCSAQSLQTIGDLMLRYIADNAEPKI